MGMRIFSGTGNPDLAAGIAERLNEGMGERELLQFPDGELHVELLDSVRCCDVYIVQSLSPPADRHLVEMLLLADASRRAGAASLTAVIPYLAYARQDRRARGREPVAARLVAELIEAAGFNRVVAVDVHSRAIEGFFGIPLEHLTAVPALAEAIRSNASTDSVIVAPDLGATKLAEHYAKLLGCPVVIVRKARLSGEAVAVSGVVGDVAGRSPIIVDDMISTGATIEAAVRALLEAGCNSEITVVTTHALLVGPAVERLRRLPLSRLVAADTVPLPEEMPLPLERVSVAELLAEAIRRLHRRQSLHTLIARD